MLYPPQLTLLLTANHHFDVQPLLTSPSTETMVPRNSAIAQELSHLFNLGQNLLQKASNLGFC